MSQRLFRYLTIMIVILLAGLPLLTACGRNNPETNSPLDSNTLATLAAQTLQAQSMQATIQAGSALLTAQAGGQAPPPQQPGEPPAQPPAEPPAQPPAEPPAGSSAPVIVASVDTNCRTGPGAEYAKVGYLGAGKQAVVLGKEPSGNFWLIANPQNSSQNCWVWTVTTTLTGDEASLPVVEGSGGAVEPPVQQPPSENGSMSATVKFSSIIVCNHASWVIFHAVNTSSLWIKSVDSRLQESGSHRDLGATRTNRPFLQAPQGCPPGVTDLKAGSEGYFAVKLNSSAKVEDNIDAVIKLCSEPDQAGKCTSVWVNFTIPAAMPPLP